MSRYIDAEWIRNVYVDFKDYEGRNDWTTPIANVLAVIDDAPSIDIVRCKECRWWINNLAIDDTDEAYDACRWDWHKDNPKADDFCSYGEREGE